MQTLISSIQRVLPNTEHAILVYNVILNQHIHKVAMGASEFDQYEYCEHTKGTYDLSQHNKQEQEN